MPLVSISDSQRRPLRRARTGSRRCTTACHRASARSTPRRGAATSPSWGACRRRKGSTAPSRSRAAPACGCASPRRSTAADERLLARAHRAALDGGLIEFIGELDEARQAGLPRQRHGAAVSDRLARALRPGDDRGDVVRHAGASPGRNGAVPEVVEHGVTGLHRRFGGRGRGGGSAGGARSTASACACASRSDSAPLAWRAITSRSIGP